MNNDFGASHWSKKKMPLGIAYVRIGEDEREALEHLRVYLTNHDTSKDYGNLDFLLRRTIKLAFAHVRLLEFEEEEKAEDRL